MASSSSTTDLTRLLFKGTSLVYRHLKNTTRQDPRFQFLPDAEKAHFNLWRNIVSSQSIRNGIDRDVGSFRKRNREGVKEVVDKDDAPLQNRKYAETVEISVPASPASRVFGIGMPVAKLAVGTVNSGSLKPIQSKVSNMKRDIIIIGGGSAGLSFACSLSSIGINCTVIEKQKEAELANPAYDGREIALTHFSRHLLQQMGAWQRFPGDVVGKIREAKVLDGNSPYALHFDYREVCDDTLGYIASNHQIRKVLYEEASSRDNITLLSESMVESLKTTENTAVVFLSDGQKLSASLIVAADSRFSASRRQMGISTSMQDFGKVAIVCKASHELPHCSTAYECFRYGGTLALLPLAGNESSVVITATPEKGHELMTQSAKCFSMDVTAQFDRRFGVMHLSGKRFSYPLVATYADRFFANRYAIIGDAAVGMHPVTAHGFNLGLKGQHILTEQIKLGLQRGVDIGSASVLSGYDSKHRRASKPFYLATNFIVDLYSDERPLHILARRAVLRLGNLIFPVKKAIMHQLTEAKEVGS